MKKAFVIVNGIQFPYFLAEHAIAKAKQTGDELQVLFLMTGEEMPEGYAFPSDIDMAETVNDKEDSEKDSTAIIQSQRKLMHHMAQSAGIQCSTVVLVEPSLRDIQHIISGGSMLFIAPEYGDVLLQGIVRPTMQEVIDESPIPVEICTGK